MVNTANDYIRKMGTYYIMDEKLMKEVMLICKGWYNKDKYANELEALNAYYHLHYCKDVEMDKELALSLFLQPLVVEVVKRKPSLISYLFDRSFGVFTENTAPFVEVLYKRIITLILMIDQNVLDTTEYDEMMEEARANGYEDTSIGII